MTEPLDGVEAVSEGGNDDGVEAASEGGNDDGVEHVNQPCLEHCGGVAGQGEDVIYVQITVMC